MIVEEAELARRLVAQHVGVLARRQRRVLVAEVDAHAVDLRFGVKRFVRAVARQCQWGEVDVHAVAEAVAVVGRKVAIDPMADAVAFGAHADRLVDQHARIGGDVDLAVEFEDAFVGLRNGDKAEQSAGNAEQAGDRVHSFTASRSSAWKKSCARKPNGPASSSSGKCWMCVLNWRTAPL